MTEAEILQSAIQAAQAAASVFGVFLTIVSAYIVGLYLFINRAGFAMKFFAFALFSTSLIAVALFAWNLQYLGEGIHEAWSKLPQKMSGMETLGPSIIVKNAFINGGVPGMWAGWLFGGFVYTALAYMTFVYRWPKAPDAQPITSR